MTKSLEKSLEESDRERILLFALSFICASTASGMIYGWPSLRRSLMSEDGFALSETELGIAFTVGSWTANGGRLASGLIRDAVGTRYTCLLCLLMVIIGALTIALSSHSDVTALTFGMLCTGLGTGVLLCVQPVCALFPKHSSTTMASLSGAFQISGMVFMVLTWVGTR